MTLKSIIFLLTLISVIFVRSQAINKLNIIAGQGFIIHLKVPQNYGKIINCWYKVYDENKTLINLNSTEPHERETGELITPYTNLICGIRVSGASVASNGNWWLEAENDQGQLINHLTVLSITEQSLLEANKIIIRQPGKNKIECSEFPLRRSCRISNQRNGILYDKCEMDDIIRNKTNYKCSFLSWGSMFETHEIITVQVDKLNKQSTEANLTENESYLLMNCQFSKKIGNCRAEYPDKIKQIYIRNGFSGKRISAFDTDLENGKCVLEIKKKLKDDEFGIWKIVSDDDRTLNGCFFYVEKNGTDKNQLIKLELDKIRKYQTIQIVNSSETELTFTCKAPFVLDYCYLRDPKQQLHIPSVYNFQQTRMLGQCIFQNTEKIPGEWICGMAGKDYEGEIVQKFKVNVIEKGVKAITKKLVRMEGQYIEMLCQSTERESLTECAFIDPKGNVYLASEDFISKDKSRVQYFGEGLNYGDCGLKIKNLKQDEIGDWTCIIKTKFSEYFNKINIAEPKIDQAIANGIGIGCSAVAVVLLMGGLFYYRRRHMQNQAKEEGNLNEREEGNPNERREGNPNERREGNPNEIEEGNPNERREGSPNERREGNPNERREGNEIEELNRNEIEARNRNVIYEESCRL